MNEENEQSAVTMKTLPNGTRFWCRNGYLHREDGPAIEQADGSRFWYRNGHLYREDGPAIERSDGSREWWVDKKQVDLNKMDDALSNVLRERDEAKAIISACANAIGNGAAASADCSLEFMAHIPTEIELHISALRSERNALRLVLAQAREGLSMLVGREMFEDQVDDDVLFLFCGPKVAREVHTLSVKDIRLARAALKAVEEALK
jgi:hypothetical protein